MHNTAFETMRDGGDAGGSAAYERALPKARALVARLRGAKTDPPDAAGGDGLLHRGGAHAARVAGW
jgi:hypothetical protein